MAVALGCGIGLAWWMYDIGSRFAGFDRGATDQELVQLRDKVKQLEADNGRLRAVQVTTDRHSQIDSAAQQDTERALKALQDENAQLKEQLAFFRGVSSGDRGGGVNVYRFKVEPGVAGVVSLPTVAGSGRAAREDFSGAAATGGDDAGWRQE